MSKIRLGLDTLKELDQGKIAAAFNRELRVVIGDCIDRPHDATPRRVTLELTVEPEMVDGVCETVLCEVQVKSKVPPRRTKKYQLEAHASGNVLFNPESPDDVRQGTLDELVEGGGGARAQE